VSTYRIDEETTPLSVISGAVRDTQTAACWIAVTQDRRFTFTTNPGSGTISSYGLSPSGELTLKQAIAADFGPASTPFDMAISRPGDLLFVIAPGNGTLEALRVENGNLTRIDSSMGVPASSSGIAAR
jgi:6-phosphogluconolactonase (cycloisomerase 2 family)